MTAGRPVERVPAPERVAGEENRNRVRMESVTDDATDLDRTHLDAALRLAHETLAAGNKPFGAVLVAADGRLLTTGRNTVTESGDPTAHAELDAVRAVAPADRDAVVGGTMYASGEPCPMCAAALVWSGVGRIVFGATAADIGAVSPAPSGFTLRCADVVAASQATIDVVGPLLGDAGLEPFRRLAH